MRCSACGTENPGDRKFCGGCGAALTRVCPSCGSPNAAQFSFCGECGSVLAEVGADGHAASGASPAASAGPEPGTVSERRVCSILFADLVGFTPLSESKDPEEVREILSRYFDVARRTVIRYGGIVEKFIGDAVMAVWGTPVADEGDAERAVRAALDLVGAVGVLGAEVGAPDLAARAGVVTGEVAVTIGAQGEGMVAGDAVNTASRVQSVAGSGTVLVDAGTRRLSESSILLEDAGNFELKGKEHPEQLFRAIRVLSGVGGKKRADGLEAPFTGRDVELRALKDLFHASVERKTPRLVVVSGPAGVGKSRLGWEFDKYIDGLADTVLWHRGRCLSYGEGVAFWALAEIVRQRFGIAEEDPTEVAASKLREGMVRYVADEAERAYVGIRLSRLLGVPYPSEAKVVFSQDELYAGWRLFFERLAQVAPVAMLVEDAQYADQSLLGFFEHLVDWTRDLSIFVILFARPGLEAIDSGYGVGRNRTTLSLDPLDDASMTLLVDSLVPGMSPAAREVITDRAQGIPLFAVETVRSLIDQGVVERDGPAYRLVQDLGALSVPGSLHALLAARLDALPAEVRASTRCERARDDLPEGCARRGLRCRCGGRHAGPVRAREARRAPGHRRPTLPRTGRLLLQSGDAPPGGLRDALQEGPQGTAPGRGGAPAVRVPERRRGDRRRPRPALSRRALLRPERPGRHRRHERGTAPADPRRRARRAFRGAAARRRELPPGNHRRA